MRSNLRANYAAAVFKALCHEAQQPFGSRCPPPQHPRAPAAPQETQHNGPTCQNRTRRRGLVMYLRPSGSSSTPSELEGSSPTHAKPPVNWTVFRRRPLLRVGQLAAARSSVASPVQPVLAEAPCFNSDSWHGAVEKMTALAQDLHGCKVTFFKHAFPGYSYRNYVPRYAGVLARSESVGR